MMELKQVGAYEMNTYIEIEKRLLNSEPHHFILSNVQSFELLSRGGIQTAGPWGEVMILRLSG